MNEIKYSVGAENARLRPCEVSLFRKVFLARVGNGATVEAAERQALHACKVWEQRGAFGEDFEGAAEQTANETRFRDGFDALCDYYADPVADSSGDVSAIAGSYRMGRLTLDEFRKKLGLDRDDG